MDINQKLLQAFQIEHIEHLERIRACLARWEDEGQVSNVDDAFRCAHTLKGAARSTGFAQVETIAHRLESVFSRVRDQTLRPEPRMLTIIQAALDAVEDSAACLLQQRPPPDTGGILQRLDALVGDVVPPPAPRSPSKREKLRAAFKEEYGTHLEAIRRLLAPATVDKTPGVVDFDEAFRCANSLKGAARLVEASAVESLAQRLEAMFLKLRQQSGPAGPTLVAEAESLLDGIDAAARAALGLGPAASTANPRLAAAAPAIGSGVCLSPGLGPLASVGQARPLAAPRTDLLTPAGDGPTNPGGPESRSRSMAPVLAADVPRSPADGLQTARGAPSGTPESLPRTGTAAASGPVATPVRETVRLGIESLDRLMQSSGQVLTEGLQQDVMARELNSVGRQVVGLEREWDSLKRTSAATLHRMNNLPEFAAVARYLDLVEHELGALSRQIRAVRRVQQRSSWSIRLAAEQLQSDVRRARMMPAESEFQGFRKMLRDLARDQNKEIEIRMTGLDVLADRMVLQSLKDPLMHVLRNAVCHGIETPDERRRAGKTELAQVTLSLRTFGNELTVLVEDNGRGIDRARVQAVAVERGFIGESAAAELSDEAAAALLFQPGFSTASSVTELAGRGMGLSAAAETVKRLQGDMTISPREGGGVRVTVRAPLSIVTHRLLLVTCAGQTFAIPASGIERLHRMDVKDVETVEGRPLVTVEGRLLPLAGLIHLLDPSQASAPIEADTLSLVVVRSGARRLAIAVDGFVAERSALIKQLGPPINRLPLFLGGVLLEDSSVALVVNPAELIERYEPSRRAWALKPGKAAETERVPHILVVDDSFTTRTLETSILETKGYRVGVAVDGIEALEQLRTERFDLVITDIQMPRLDGFGLLEAIKRDARLMQTPVIIVSSVEKREEQERGLSLGADAYIIKQKFDHQELLATIQQIL